MNDQNMRHFDINSITIKNYGDILKLYLKFNSLLINYKKLSENSIILNLIGDTQITMFLSEEVNALKIQQSIKTYINGITMVDNITREFPLDLTCIQDLKQFINCLK